jgi:hypothetical protein
MSDSPNHIAPETATGNQAMQKAVLEYLETLRKNRPDITVTPEENGRITMQLTGLRLQPDSDKTAISGGISPTAPALRYLDRIDSLSSRLTPEAAGALNRLQNALQNAIPRENQFTTRNGDRGYHLQLTQSGGTAQAEFTLNPAAFKLHTKGQTR